jgi:predicted nuclease of predicted toxin-antitoxin system
MLRYYFDEHMSAAIAMQLRTRGVDVETAYEAGRAGRKISDIEQPKYATSQGRVLVSIDRDFARLNASHIAHAGMILLQRRLGIGQLVEYLELMAKTTTPHQMQDQLMYCDW